MSATSAAAPGKSDGGRQARSAARLAAVQALYQMDVAQTPLDDIIDEFVDHRLGREIEGAIYAAADKAHFEEVVRGVVRAQRVIDEEINGALARGWALARMDSTLRAVLRAGTYELKERPDIPLKVAINEYVDVAHAFFEGEEPGVVNAVLDRLGRRLRAVRGEKDAAQEANGGDNGQA